MDMKKHKMREKGEKRMSDDDVPDVVKLAKDQPPGAKGKESAPKKLESVFGDDHLDHDAFSDKMTKSIRT